MWGKPKDVEGQCNARLFIADDYGDGTATMRCQLALGHDGVHREDFERKGDTVVTVTWVTDERKKCDHGCGQWEHDHRDKSIKCQKDADDHEYSDCASCFPDKEGETCAECGKTYYYEDGHKQHCPGQSFACIDCGENGHGFHACPKSPDQGFDEFPEEP